MTVLKVLTRSFRRLVACLAGIAALFLVGGKIDGTVEFQADGRVLIDLTVEDSDGDLTKINQRCEALRVMVLGQVKFIRNPKVEDITPPGGRTTCRVTSKEPFVGGFGFKKTKTRTLSCFRITTQTRTIVTLKQELSSQCQERFSMRLKVR